MKHLLLSVLIVLGTACGSKPLLPGTTNKTTKSEVAAAVRDTGDDTLNKTDDTQTAQAQKPNDEGIAVPTNISGALLHCALATDPAKAGPEIAIGCRLEDDKGVRIPLKAVAELSIFSYQAPEGSDVAISVKNLEDSSDYDVAYYFKGKDKSESQAVAAATDVQIVFHNPLNGEKDKGISVKLGSILVVAVAAIKELHDLAQSVYAVIVAKPESTGAKKKADEIEAILEMKKGEIIALFKKIIAEAK